MESAFRSVWTENGDHLSLMYASSRYNFCLLSRSFCASIVIFVLCMVVLCRAMKRDVTRNGVRTQRGAVDDAMAAARRYFANNLRDLRRQLGIDVLLGLARYQDLAHHSCASHSVIRVSSQEGGSVAAGGSGERVEMELYAPKAFRAEYARRVLSSALLRHQEDHKFGTTTPGIAIMPGKVKSPVKVVGIKIEDTVGDAPLDDVLNEVVLHIEDILNVKDE